MLSTPAKPYNLVCPPVPSMLVLSWNLFHGRSLAPTRRELLGEFAAQLAAWEWDVALLQEVPPWWPAALVRVAGAEQRAAMTSRNSLLALRRVVARRDPELAKSNGGGCNVILSRAAIAEHATRRLRAWPERRVAQLVRLDDAVCVVNFHASTRAALAEDELARLWQCAERFAGDRPLILGGDLNLREPLAPSPDIAHVARHAVDHIFTRGLVPVGDAEVLPRRAELDGRQAVLSDHAPLRVRLRPQS
jgi:endonuclease/exonuclease/phosphatase family metal-dependent hydrolase